MTITNGHEIRIQIRKLGFNQKEFAEEAGVSYGYLNNTINGYHTYREVIAAFDKYGITYKSKEKDSKKKSIRKVA